MAELAAERGVPLPTLDPDALGRFMLVSDAHSLEEYLERFVLTLSVMQDAQAIERIAYELVEDHHAENVRYVEVRFCPALCTRDGLRPDEVLDAALDGIHRSRARHPVSVGVIVCGLRTLDPSVSVAMAELAVAYQNRGVVAFDLAGAEAGNPVHEHVEAFALARAAGLPVTVHGGEGFGAPSIEEALFLAGASRLGHGTRLFEDPGLLAHVRDQRIPLEVCLTSNVQTGVASSYAAHPVRRYRSEGIPVILCTDNRLMSGVTLTREYEHAHEHLGWAWSDLVDVARTGFARAFVEDAERERLLKDFEDEVGRLG
jgi:adenosine deaminase